MIGQSIIPAPPSLVRRAPSRLVKVRGVWPFDENDENDECDHECTELDRLVIDHFPSSQVSVHF